MERGFEREDDLMQSDFERKASELDFDVWGSDPDETARRRDPLRRRSSRSVQEDEVDDLE